MSGEDRRNQTLHFNVTDVITLTARLAQVMAEEVDLLREMKVSKIEALQKEKLFLTGALEAYRKLLERQPELLRAITPQQRKDLEDITRVFNDVLKQNHDRLLVAKEVNHRVVQAIRACVTEKNGQALYNRYGYAATPGSQSLSVTLNKHI